MLEAVPSKWYSNNYCILQDGLPLAEIKRSWLRERGSITVEGRTYTISRDGLTGPFLLETDGSVVATAKPRLLRRIVEIDYEGRLYLLRAPSIWRRTFVLESEGTTLGTIRSKNPWSRKAVIEIPNFPLAVVLFFFWLVVIMWQREKAAEAGAAVAVGV
jgi:hypothetical protein